MWCLQYRVHVLTKNIIQQQQLRCLSNTSKLLNSSSRSSTSSNPIAEGKVHHEQITPESSKKLRARLPLVKNFFVGTVDKELLAYPEVIPRDDMDELQNVLKPLNDYFSEEFVLKKTLAEDLKHLELYGVNAPINWDGKGWNFSGSLMATEPECLASMEVALGLLGHRAVIDVLLEKGTSLQQQQFLSKLTKGSMVASEAFLEDKTSEESIFNTKAVYDVTNHSWTLNGSKTFVVMPPKTSDATQLFVVLAQTERFNNQDKFLPTITILLVDSNTSGVKIGERVQTLGAVELEMRDVHFENVQLNDVCVLGNAHEGDRIMEYLLKYNRLRYATIATSMAKKVLNYLTQQCTHTKHFNVLLKDLESVQTHLASANTSIYGMESMIYFTAGLMDEFQNPDVVVEAAITKYFSLKELFKIIQSSLEIIGAKSLVIGQKTETFARNAFHLYTHSETMDALGVFIALSGLNHAGVLLGENIRRQRNPLYNPIHIFSKFMEKSNIDNPQTKMALNENLHPSLQPSSICLEHSVARLQMCVDLLLTRYGNNIVEQHNESLRLAEMSSTIYVMFASLARASRSYCIGLPLSDYELLAASTICLGGHNKIKNLSVDIFHGQYVNNDYNWQRLSKQVIKSKGFFAVHPLTYNF